MFRKSPLTILEAETRRLDKRFGELSAGRNAATAERDAAKATVIEALISGNVPAEASARLRAAVDRLDATDAAVAEVARRQADVAARLAVERDRIERERVAGECEARCAAVEEAATEMDTAVRQLALAHRSLIKAIPPGANVAAVRHGALATHREVLGREAIARLILAAALARAAPEAFVEEVDEMGVASVLRRGYPVGDVVKFVFRDPAILAVAPTAAEPVKSLITDRLREHAASVRNGSILPIAPRDPAEPEPDFRPNVGNRRILPKRPLRYVGRTGEPVLISPWAVWVPTIVAEAALRRGLADDLEGPDGPRLIAEAQARSAREANRHDRTIRSEDAVDIGVDLSAWLAAEVESMRREWDAGTGREA